MVQGGVTPEVICLAIALTTGAAGSGPRPIVASERAVAQLSARFREWLADPSPTATAAIRERVELGAPPVALIAVLDGLRTHPRVALLDVVQSLATYRQTQVRAHAIAAWAEHGPAAAIAAIAAAATDLEPSIRALAPALAERHPSDLAEQIVVDLLARDEALAAALAASEAEAP